MMTDLERQAEEKVSWRTIRRKIKNREELTDDEQYKLDRAAYIWMYISIGVSLPMAIASIVLSLLTVLCMP